MNFAIFALLCSVAIFQVNCQGDHAHGPHKFFESAKQCCEEAGITDKDKCKEVMTGKVEMDDSTKCLHYCMEQKMTADGHTKEEVLDKFPDGPDKEGIKGCLESTKDVADNCDRANKLHDCSKEYFHKMIPKH